MFGELLDNVIKKAPLIHNITNYVTVNDVANAVLACGASPIMADDDWEAEEITSICGGLNINIGTLNHRTISSMLLAGKKANELRHPVVLDPVGAGASGLRTGTALRLLREIRFTAVRGNMSEIRALAGAAGSTRGVDADYADAVTEDSIDKNTAFVRELAGVTGSVIAVTGAIDIVSDSRKCYLIRNGRPEMSRITGTGCQLSGIMAAYLTANPESPLDAAAAAVCLMGLAGEIAWGRMREGDGNATYRNRIIDAVYNMDALTLDKGARYEIR